jgi:hypothetical protein
VGNTESMNEHGAEQAVRVNTDETTGTASNNSAHLRECTGVQKERKNQKKRALTRLASLEMTHYPVFRPMKQNKRQLRIFGQLSP